MEEMRDKIKEEKSRLNSTLASVESGKHTEEKIAGLTMDELISEINKLAAKNKTSGLNDEEIELRAKLRNEYVRRFRASLRSELDSIYYIDDNGKERPLGRSAGHKSNK